MSPGKWVGPPRPGWFVLPGRGYMGVLKDE